MAKIQTIVRALIIHDDKVLLAHGKKYSHTYLPGGHFKLGECMEDTLKSEIH
jgi:ADP-ribose pyrophosphatase YjhB (NUDIX family)